MATTLLDLDGPCNDFSNPMDELLCDILNTDRVPANNWHWYRGYGISDEEFVRHLNDFADKGLFTAKPPHEGVPEAIQRLKSMGHTVHVVTDRPVQIYEETADWLRRYGIPFDTLTISRDKTVFMQYGPSPYYGLDDRPENVVACRAAGARAFMFVMEHNKDIDLPRVYSVEEYVDLVINEQLTP